MAGDSGARAGDSPLMRSLAEYLSEDECEQVERTLRVARDAYTTRVPNERGPHPLDDALAVAGYLAQMGRAGPVTLAATLLYAPIATGALKAVAVRAQLGADFGREVVALIEGMRTSPATEPPAPSQSPGAEADIVEAASRETIGRQTRKNERKRRRHRNAELRNEMLLLARQDPRIAVWKIAQRLHLMESVRLAAERHRRDGDDAAAWPDDEGSDAPELSAAVDSPRSQGAHTLATRWAPEACITLAHETRDAFVPVAAHLGARRLEGRLQDHAFAVLQPDEYRRLDATLAAKTQGWQPYLERVRRLLAKELRGLALAAEVSYRVKAVYSVHQKLKRIESSDPAELFDLLAVRIICEGVEDCYRAFDLVHTLWPPIDGRVKDYIAAPKKNGYQSLHTTVRCVDERMVEVQIRTRRMHILAEYGMHWFYKNTNAATSPSLEESTELAETVLRHQERIRQAYQAPEDATQAEERPEAAEHDHLHLYTPEGLLKTLPRGATALDFAYYVHTGVGNHAVGAQVIAAPGVRRPIPLDSALQGGETIEILRRDDVHPTYEWLDRAQTKKARTEIMRYLRAHRREADLERLGREQVEAGLRALGLGAHLEDLPAPDLSWLLQQLRRSSVSDLLVAVGSDGDELASLRALLRARLQMRPDLAPSGQGEPAGRQAVSLGGLRGILTRPANCCHPLPGDELIGFVSHGSGIAIHRADCSNVPHLRARFPERIVAVEWPSDAQARGLRVHVVVEGEERVTLVRDIMGILDRHGVPALKLDPAEKSGSQHVVVDMLIEIHDLGQIHSVLRDLRAAPNVVFADRQRPGGRLVGATKRTPRRPTARER